MSEMPKTDALIEHARTMAEVLDSHEQMEHKLAAVTLAHKAAEDRAIVVESRLSDEMALSRKLAAELAAVTAERNEARTKWTEAVQDADRAIEIARRVDAKERDALKAERDALRSELHSALIDCRGHLFRESCPEPSDMSERDPECPVCRRLQELDAAIAASKENP